MKPNQKADPRVPATLEQKRSKDGDLIVRCNDATWNYLTSERKEIVIGPMCNCLSFPLPHELSAHRSLKSEHDWTPWQERYVLNEKYNCYELKREYFQERIR